ncbi:hypothetical protein CATMQ487_32240 [Sphaerotilus microaerophilus]|uniref:Uncharacterized protein n=1 Tax=Sphaerotilus microaerophilus TaxID=2914710 RepID=A0ABN6PM66_9BURK|nr:hypothetical protein CATMQ487_32240 [Sphaerotilus sp. FB-5]
MLPHRARWHHYAASGLSMLGECGRGRTYAYPPGGRRPKSMPEGGVYRICAPQVCADGASVCAYRGCVASAMEAHRFGKRRAAHPTLVGAYRRILMAE